MRNSHSDERVRRQNAIRMPMLILGLVFTVTYLGLGAYILLTPSFLADLPSEYRNIFAGMLLVYGAYRGWRIYSDHVAR